MILITQSRLYGIAVTLVLLAFFVVPPQAELFNTPCSVLSFAASGCEAGVRGVFRGAILYCFLAGYLVSRTLDRDPVGEPWTALAVVAAAMLFALPLWLGLHAAFW